MKDLFRRDNKHSKGYVFISEHEDGTIVNLESRCVIVLRGEFPTYK